MPGIGVGIGLPFRNIADGYPSILDDGNTVGWYDMSTDYVVKDVSDRVSQWTDRTGLGHHLLQATGADQPLWSSTGIKFDGVSEYMKTAAFTFNQPEFIYLVLQQYGWLNGEYILDGNGNASGSLTQSTTTPDIRAYAGTNSALNSNLTLSNFAIVRLLFNGASSSLQINETAATTGDFGSGNMGGFTLARVGALGINFTRIEAKEIILRNSADNATNQGLIYDYLKDKYSL